MPPPDADIHGEATGPAKILVNKHSEPQPVKLYAGWFCPFVQRVWTVLEEKRIPYQYIEVNPYHKPESLLELNPRGLVPTLQYDNKPLYESTVILEFLEDAYPEHGSRLLPADPYSRAQVRIWIDFVTTRVIPSFHRFLQSQSDSFDAVRSEFLDTLKEFSDAMDENPPFFLGEAPSLVDFVLAPWAIRLWVFDHYKGGLKLPREGEGSVDEKSWNRWRQWLAAVEERKSIKETTSETEYYLPIYQRYADNTAQSELAKATRAGKGVP